MKLLASYTPNEEAMLRVANIALESPNGARVATPSPSVAQLAFFSARKKAHQAGLTAYRELTAWVVGEALWLIKGSVSTMRNKNAVP